METAIPNFLKDHCDPSKPVLLALSGGPDSLACLHLLLKYQSNHPLKLGIAHVDHGWRIESAQEAQILQEKAASLRNPFHLKRLIPADSAEGNLEALCREERLSFFRVLCQEFGYQAVILAHHADDQSETVLKRVFEGASLPHLGGLRAVTEIKGLILWRPLLDVSKQVIEEWLLSNAMKGFQDWTNYDPKFLRGRLRTRLLPLLSQEFGKEISPALRRLGKEAGELQDYLHRLLSPYFSRFERGPWGEFLDLSRERPADIYELKFLIQQFCTYADLSLSRIAIETAAHLVQSLAADKQLCNGKKTLFIDRGRLFVAYNTEVLPPDEKPVTPGCFQQGPWKVQVTHEEAPMARSACDWKRVWEGFFEVWLPPGTYSLGPPVLQASYPGTSPVSKWWTAAKVPAFLRQWVPVVWREQKIYYEFLTGRTPPFSQRLPQAKTEGLKLTFQKQFPPSFEQSPQSPQRS